MKGFRISKPSPLFAPIKSSKQDRREKKRKIIVSQLFKKKPRTSHTDEKSKKTIGSESPASSPNTYITSYSADVSQDSFALKEEDKDTNIEMTQQEPNNLTWKIQ